MKFTAMYKAYELEYLPCNIIMRKKCQPDEVLSFEVDSVRGAKRKATNWAGKSVFGDVQWQNEYWGFEKYVIEDGIETVLVLAQSR